jgi:hypothetical protein
MWTLLICSTNSKMNSILSFWSFSNLFYLVIPLFVAIINIGAISLSNARFKNEKHSISNIWTSSINKTPGTISAFPSSRHSATLSFICSRTSDLISPVSPENNARKPWERLLITSISCNVTVWTTSLRFCNSPSGHWTNFV